MPAAQFFRPLVQDGKASSVRPLPAWICRERSAPGALSQMLFRFEQAVLEGTALVDAVAMRSILGDADRAWIEAEDIGVA